jgi:hypothetical protein
MKYALNLADDRRILSVTFEQYAPADAVLVEEFPENVTDYRYVDGRFVHDPLPKPAEVIEPTQLDRIEAQVAYTAMMTDTLLEV